MKIKTILSEYKNDFSAVMVCEHCGFEWTNNYGYHDQNYHVHVIPNIYCNKCGKNREGKQETKWKPALATLLAILLLAGCASPNMTPHVIYLPGDIEYSDKE